MSIHLIYSWAELKLVLLTTTLIMITLILGLAKGNRVTHFVCCTFINQKLIVQTCLGDHGVGLLRGGIGDHGVGLLKGRDR